MKSIIHRKESVILTAIEIIDELGIQGLSSKEIARRQDISEGTLFKHFKTKNEIIIGVLNNFSQFDGDIMESVKLKNAGFVEAITYFVKSYAEYYENYPAITSLHNAYEIFRWDKELSETYKDIVNRRSDFITELVEKAQDSGEISKDIKSEDATILIWGTFLEITLRWRMAKYSFSFKEKALSTLDIVLKGFLIQ